MKLKMIIGDLFWRVVIAYKKRQIRKLRAEIEKLARVQPRCRVRLMK
jgi:hypothetical protein